MRHSKAPIWDFCGKMPETHRLGGTQQDSHAEFVNFCNAHRGRGRAVGLHNLMRNMQLWQQQLLTHSRRVPIRIFPLRNPQPTK
jgi:hypothetical protein